METTIKLPIGIEDFEEIRTEGFYYVDKTGLIKELLDNWGKVNLFTRPRRFGKSLNMSMLKKFFEYGCDSRLFDGLAIAGEKELCDRYMGKFPVVSVSLKDVGGKDYGSARAMLRSVIANEAMRFQFLSKSDKLSDEEVMQYRQLIKVDASGKQGFIMPEEVMIDSLLTLTKLLQKHHSCKVILLIDEYDVPLDKAQHFGYYDEMIVLIRNMYSRVLKSNGSLQLAVLTGCLKVAKESIFTGLNNMKVFSITNVQFEERFGFSDGEVRELLDHYGFGGRFDDVKEWYNGYRFGNADVYCPWDVLNYVDLMRSEPNALPKAFWIHTSGNDIVKRFIQMAKISTRRELERLVAGESIAKKIDQELTYYELYSNIDNLWSVLFMTGYLTQRGEPDGDIYRLVIPNMEVRKIFIDQILEWFQQEARKDAQGLDAFCEAFLQADEKAVEAQFNAYLKKTISIRDTSVRKSKKENFYHGILLGLLSHREDWDVTSNVESGDGFSDILVELEEEGIGIVIEVKYPDGGDLEAGCAQALDQIEEMGYADRLCKDGMMTIMKYGIACNKKQCRVKQCMQILN